MFSESNLPLFGMQDEICMQSVFAET